MSIHLPEPGAYCFTLDDNIRFLEECTRFGYQSIFQHPYMALFRRMHEKYHAKFQFNMYDSYSAGGFSLSQVPDRWSTEFEENADWMRFSFHARHNDPAFPYESCAPQRLVQDFQAVMTQLRRITGKAATNVTTTLHYVCAPREACAALKDQGLRALIGMFYPLPGREALRYYLTEEQAAQLQRTPLWYDEDIGLTFACNDAVLNTLPLEQVVPTLQGRKKAFYHVMIHEQYFYPDYPGYQPDFVQKVEAALALFQSMGLPSCFLEEII